MIAPCEFQGIQEGFEHIAAYPVYNLTRDIPGHRAGSTLSGRDIERAGYTIPAIQLRRAKHELKKHNNQKVNV